ncbi:MAG TPA: Stk1 family PASTA domain-containing Ser/Thr kinase [Clostridiales bacterium]|nr:Stk1 family PASTA domain-containing Ser/Thr kinase [Clostridiales bacterium]
MDRYIGKRLDGRYEIKEIIGVGGMAVVYKAYDSIEDRIVAVKILKEEFVSNEEFLRRFKNESKAIAVLSHPNIVKVFDVSFGNLIQYIVMEYIDGITLKEYIERQGSLRWKDAVHFTIQILRGLQHAHDKGIVHRDVKPQNIMLLADGTIKVTDFGIARFARSEHRTMTDKAIGSVHYISPEQARGEVTDEKTDIYSVGVMLYEMLTGRLPFQAESAVSVAIMQLQTEPKLPREINGSIPTGLEQITLRAMQKDPEKRYKSAAEMLRDLEEFRRDPSITFDYDYYIDNSPTKFVTGKFPKQEDVVEELEEEAPAKSPVVPALAGIAITFTIFLIIVGILLVPRFFGPTGSEIVCPNLIGKVYEEIKDDPQYSDIVINVISFENNNEYESGKIFWQKIDPGKAIKKGSSVDVKVSLGKKTIRVPDVTNFDLPTAISELKAQGITNITRVEKQDDTVAKGSVIKTVPAAGESMYEGDEIKVYVSIGPPTVYVDVPNVVGLLVSDARTRIEEYGLTTGTVTEVDSEAPAGIVIRQDPDPKNVKQVAKDSQVNLIVSNGKPPVVTYKIDLTVDLPDDYVSSTLILSAWIDGVKVLTSGEIDSHARDEYQFKDFESTLEEAIVQIKIESKVHVEPEPYCDYLVNFKEGTYKLVKRYTGYTKATSSTPSNTDD